MTACVYEKIVLVKMLTKFQSILYRILCSFKTVPKKVLIFEIWLFENQSPDGLPSGPCVREGLRKKEPLVFC